jgi:hypothetical protein
MGPGEVKRKDPKQKERKMIFTISQSKNGRWILSFRGRRVLAHFKFGGHLLLSQVENLVRPFFVPQ